MARLGACFNKLFFLGFDPRVSPSAPTRSTFSHGRSAASSSAISATGWAARNHSCSVSSSWGGRPIIKSAFPPLLLTPLRIIRSFAVGGEWVVAETGPAVRRGSGRAGRRSGARGQSPGRDRLVVSPCGRRKPGFRNRKCCSGNRALSRRRSTAAIEACAVHRWESTNPEHSIAPRWPAVVTCRRGAFYPIAFD